MKMEANVGTYGSKLAKLLTNREFALLFMSQAFTNIGESFQFVAITLKIYQMTGSGLKTGFIMILPCIASMIFSPILAIKSNRIKEGKMLIILGLAKAFVTFCFVNLANMYAIYMLLFVSVALDILYAPPKNKILKKVVKKERLLLSLAMLNGLSAGVFLIGPPIAASVIRHYGTNYVFIINTLSFVLSAAILLNLKEGFLKPKGGRKGNGVFCEAEQSDIQNFSVKELSTDLASLLKIGFWVGLTSNSVSLAIYALAFDTLGVSNHEWGIILGIFNGSGLMALIASFFLTRKFRSKPMYWIYAMIGMISLTWIAYSIRLNFNQLLFLLFLEGTASGLLGIFYTFRLLQLVSMENTLRVNAISDFFSNAGRVIGLVLTFGYLNHFEIRKIFMLNAMLILSMVVFTIFKRSR